MLLAVCPNICSVIRLPLNQQGEDLVTGAPALVSPSRLKKLRRDPSPGVKPAGGGGAGEPKSGNAPPCSPVLTFRPPGPPAYRASIAVCCATI